MAQGLRAPFRPGERLRGRDQQRRKGSAHRSGRASACAGATSSIDGALDAAMAASMDTLMS
jgi:hypothetical protein